MFKIIIIYLLIFFQLQSLEKIDFLVVHSNFNPKKDEEWLYKRLVPESFNCYQFSLYDIDIDYNNPILPFITNDNSSIGQESDIQLMLNELKNIHQTIAIGSSLGAAVLLNIMTYSSAASKIKGLVLHNCFANANDIICKVFYLDFIPGGSLIAKQIAKFFFPNYNPNGIQPLFSIQNIRNKNLPILLIHAKNDNVIDINHSRKLYIELIENGFKNVFLLETKRGEHGNIILANCQLLQKIAFTFYKELKLIEQRIIKEGNLESVARPDVESVIRKIKSSSNREYFAKFSKFLIIGFILYKFYKKQLYKYKFYEIFINYINFFK